MSAAKTNIRERVLKAAMPDIAREGFTDAVLEKAARKLDMRPIEAKRAFPNGAAGLAEEFSRLADERMAAKMKGLKDKSLTARIRNAVRFRIEALEPHRNVARRAGSFFAMPQNAPLGMKLVYRTVDAMWRAAGDRSTDFNFYTKRATLACVYGSTLLFWLNDDSKDNAKTWEFLDHRLADVMAFEKFKGAARQALSEFPDPLGVFGRTARKAR